MPAVLMVCLGNICRSPMAEAVLRHLARARPDGASWSVDSAGTGPWHVGDPPHRSTRTVLAEAGIAVDHLGRQVDRRDFDRFDWVLAMDGSNLADLRSLAPPRARAELRLLGEFDPEGVREVPDPYGQALPAFRAVLRQVERACRGFLAECDRRALGR